MLTCVAVTYVKFFMQSCWPIYEMLKTNTDTLYNDMVVNLHTHVTWIWSVASGFNWLPFRKCNCLTATFFQICFKAYNWCLLMLSLWEHLTMIYGFATACNREADKPFSKQINLSGKYTLTIYLLNRVDIHIYLHLMSLLHIDMTRVVEILPNVRQVLTYST